MPSAFLKRSLSGWGWNTSTFTCCTPCTRPATSRPKSWAWWTGCGSRKPPGASGTWAFPATTTPPGWNISSKTCQLQYNYLDTDDRAEEISGTRGYQLTEEYGVPLIIMEPIKGGTLAALPADAAAPLRSLRPAASDASWALRWVGSHKNVHCILSGMSTEEQLADNLATFARFAPLSTAETAAVEKAAAILHSRIRIGCTGCRYCMPCPMGVDIPDNFSIWNRLGMFQQPEAIKTQWTERFPDSEKALHCIRCGKCETVCPQKLPIRTALAAAQAELDAL